MPKKNEKFVEGSQQTVIKTKTKVTPEIAFLAAIVLVIAPIILGLFVTHFAFIAGMSGQNVRMAATNTNTNTNTAVSAVGDSFVRGDANQDGKIDIGDSVAINSVVSGTPVTFYSDCQKAFDVDDNGAVNKTDFDYLIAYLFSGGSAPKAPFSSKGYDPTSDSLTCSKYTPTTLPSNPNSAQAKFIRGDVDGNGKINMDDVIYIIGLLPQDKDATPGTFPCDKAADVNNDGKLNIDDGTYLLSYLYGNGPKPPAPNSCGIDTTADNLLCNVSKACTPSCTDKDADGYGANGTNLAGCKFSQPDCNDNNSKVYPGATEICGNSIDEDCNGYDKTCSSINTNSNTNTNSNINSPSPTPSGSTKVSSSSQLKVSSTCYGAYKITGIGLGTAARGKYTFLAPTNTGNVVYLKDVNNQNIATAKYNWLTTVSNTLSAKITFDNGLFLEIGKCGSGSMNLWGLATDIFNNKLFLEIE